ncbi:hypothetical protein MACH09_45400 [Vibrio sp. MACH09]|uniref:hypothetical protein n=1 Tax=Vibrio sp. MACH09 TaxID=3025122 RepID=UPI0027931F86|nr:hypothetical protein [Vibrio sp. MACH09]GLO64032.1 hypothetical protein MACH09_45400 [Vibrio sp. MACH09]
MNIKYKVSFIILALLSTFNALAKVTYDEAIEEERAYSKDNKSVVQNHGFTEEDLRNARGGNTPNNLEYIGRGSMRLPDPGMYFVDTSGGTSTVYVPSLSGSYYGTSSVISNSAYGVIVRNGVVIPHSRYGSPSIRGIYKVK